MNTEPIPSWLIILGYLIVSVVYLFNLIDDPEAQACTIFGDSWIIWTTLALGLTCVILAGVIAYTRYQKAWAVVFLMVVVTAIIGTNLAVAVIPDSMSINPVYQCVYVYTIPVICVSILSSVMVIYNFQTIPSA